MRRHGSDSIERATSTTTQGNGAFVLEGVALGPCRLWAHADGMRYSWTPPCSPARDTDVHGVELVLTPLLATDRIEGRVVDPDGAPLTGAELRYFVHAGERSHATSKQVDEHGAFSPLMENDDSTCDFTALDPEARFAATTVKDVRPGTLDLVIRMLPKHTLSVRLRDKQDLGVEGATLSVYQRGFEADAPTTIRAPGDYDISVPDDEFHLSIEAPGFRSGQRGPFVGAALPGVLDIVMRRAPSVHGRVLADGAPLSGVKVRLASDDPGASGTIDGFRFCSMAQEWGVSTTSDAQGRFQLSCDVDRGFWLRASVEGCAPGELGPIDPAQLAPDREFDIALDHGGAIEGHVLLPDGKDAEGAIVAINHADGEPLTRRADSKGFYRFEGLCRGPWQVLARETERDPARRSYASTQDNSPIEWSCEVTAGATTRYDLDLTRK